MHHALVPPGGKVSVSARHWLKAVGKWQLGVITAQEGGTTEAQVNTLEKGAAKVFLHYLVKRHLGDNT